MANELKPCPFCGGSNIRTDIGLSEFHDGEVTCEDCGANVGNHEDVAKAITAWNTRPAAPVEGLVERGMGLREGNNAADILAHKLKESEAIIAAERTESDEAYELGKRDGYSEAVQEIDLKTGGDGEYRYCTDHDPERHTPDPESMIQRIVERFETLNTMESISEINEWKERAEKAEADNAALTARVKELENINADLCRSHGVLNVTGSKLETKVETLETQLAAARKALERAAHGFDQVHKSLMSNGPKQASGEVTAFFLAETNAALEGKP